MLKELSQDIYHKFCSMYCVKGMATYLIHVRSDEFHTLVQSVRIAAARIEDESAQRCVRQEFRISINLVQNIQHGFQPLHALLFFHGTARWLTDGAWNLEKRMIFNISYTYTDLISTCYIYS